MEIKFVNKEEWEKWLNQNYSIDHGIFIIFDKTKRTSTLTSNEALDIALRYGWIDGVIKKIDDDFYMKYFKKRAKKSIWSTKNKTRVNELLSEGLMMPSGLEILEMAKANGCFDKGDELVDYNLDLFKELLKEENYEGYLHFNMFSPSIQKTYASSYFVLKKKETRNNRLKVIINRSLKNLKPME